jgi:hypothetical protein
MSNGNMGIKKKDLKDNYPVAIAVSEDREKEEQNKIHYPSFSLTDKHIEAAGLKNANPDEVFEFKVRARVQSVAKKGAGAPSYDSNRVELEVQDISDVTMIDGEEAEDSDEKKDLDSKLGFDSGAVKKKGAASISPKEAGRGFGRGL